MAVVNLGKTDFFLGLDWLRLHNPNIDWEQSTLMFDQCPDRCGHLPVFESPEDDNINVEEKLEEGEHLYWMDWDKYIGLDLRSSGISDTAEPYLKEYADVFSSKDFDQIPERRPWDHAIDLTPGSKPVDCKVYPITQPSRKL